MARRRCHSGYKGPREMLCPPDQHAHKHKRMARNQSYSDEDEVSSALSNEEDPLELSEDDGEIIR